NSRASMASCRSSRRPPPSTGIARRRSPCSDIRRSGRSRSSRWSAIVRSSDPAAEDLTYLLTRVLRGTSDTTALLVAIDPQTLVDAAEAHGVLPLVADALTGRQRLPPALGRALRD